MEYLSKLDSTTHIKDLSKDELIDLQQALFNLGYKDIWIDGIYGKQTRKIFNNFKADFELDYPDYIGHTTINFILNLLTKEETAEFVLLDKPQTIGGKLMLVKIPPNWVQRKLEEKDFIKLASLFNLNIATIKAVMEVESNGSGFLLNEAAPCRPKILFEGHIFYNQTSQPVSKIRPDLSYPRWTKKYYKGGSAEWGRLLDAFKFDASASLKSASWGLGQIMGFNYSTLGYSSVEEMVIDAHKDEYHQARQMFDFCKNHPSGKLIPALRVRDWATFAYYYNGSGYRQNNYDAKLKNAYLKFAK